MFRPLRDNVLVRPDPEAEKSAGGIIIPERHRTKALSGEVVAIGPGRRAKSGERLPMAVKVGDKIQYTPLSANWQEIEQGGEKLTLIMEGDIVGVQNGN